MSRLEAAPDRAEIGHGQLRRFSPASRREQRQPRIRSLDLATLDTQADQTENTLAVRLDHRFNDAQSFYVRYLISDGDVDTPDRTVTPRRVLAKQQPQNFVVNYQSICRAELRQRAQGRLQRAADERDGVRRRAGLRPCRRVAVGHVHVLVHRRSRHHGHRPQRLADSCVERLVDDRLAASIHARFRSATR